MPSPPPSSKTPCAAMGESPRRGRGFERTSSLLRSRIREASEGRGHVAVKLAVHWREIVGPEIASRSRPVKVSYAGKGLGATLTLLTTGPEAPVVDMQRERIRERVNAVYGYGLVTHVRLTQTSPQGFAEGQAPFDPPSPRPEPPDDARAREITAGVASPELREALAALARNVMKRQETS